MRSCAKKKTKKSNTQELNESMFSTIRHFLNYFYAAVGIGVLSFLFLVAYRVGIPNMAFIAFYVFLGLYMMFAKDFINDLKKRQSRWSHAKYIISMIALWLPVTLINLGFIYSVFIANSGMYVPVLLWVVLLLAWTIVPVNVLFDYLEEQ